MSKKKLPVTLLVSGLLAAPGLGVAPVRAEATQAPIVEVSGAETFPAEMPAEVLRRYRRWTRGERPDVAGMQAMQDKIAAKMQTFLAGAITEPGIWKPNAEFEISAPLPATHAMTFLGVATVAVPHALAVQLNLRGGWGCLCSRSRRIHRRRRQGCNPMMSSTNSTISF